MQQDVEQLLSKKQIAKLLGVSEASVTRWICAGIGPRYHRVGLAVRFRLADVNRWLEQRAVEPTEAA